MFCFDRNINCDLLIPPFKNILYFLRIFPMESIKDLKERSLFRSRHILNEHEVFIPHIGEHGWHGMARLIQDEDKYFILVKKNKRRITVAKMMKTSFSLKDAKFLMHSFLVRHNYEDHLKNIPQKQRKEFYEE